jgi:hypothetical protein
MVMAVGELLPKIFEGPIGPDAVVKDHIAAGAIDLWAPVILVAPGTGEDLARVNTVASANSVLCYGIVVGPIRASGKAADAAGDKVNVCVFGPCKVKVNGALAVGALIATSATAGKAGAATPAIGAVIGKLLAASGADGDIVPCFVDAA